MAGILCTTDLSDIKNSQTYTQSNLSEQRAHLDTTKYLMQILFGDSAWSPQRSITIGFAAIDIYYCILFRACPEDSSQK